MSFAPLAAAPVMIQIHALAALAALALGAVQLAARKGAFPHRLMGWTWVALMGVVAGSAFGIPAARPLLGPFGWIHLLAAVTFVLLPRAVLHARRGQIANHRRSMTWLFAGALVVAGLFTLVPGRIMHAVVLAD